MKKGDLMVMKAAMASINIVSIFAKTPPKATKVKGGFIFDFIDVLSVTKQQEIVAKNFDPDDLKKFIEKELNKELKPTDGKQMKRGEHES